MAAGLLMFFHNQLLQDGSSYMRSKLLVLLTVLALVLGTFSGAMAQDAPEVFCGDLAEEDCAILQESRAATMQMAQGTSQLTLDVTEMGLLQLLLGMPVESSNATLTANLVSVADPTAMAAIQTLDGATQEEIMQMMADDPQALLDFYSGWDFDASVGLSLTPEIADLISVQSGLDFPAEIAMEAKMVDGVIYWDLSEVAAFVPTVAAGWVGFPMAEFMQEMENQGMLDEAVAAMNEQNAGMSGTAMAGFGSVQFFQDNAEMFQQYTTVTRGEDVELDGQTGATFTMNFDAAAFLSGPEVQQMIVDLANAGAFEGTGLNAADIEQNIQMLSMMGPMLFTGITATATQTIGLDDLLQYDYESELSWDMAGLLQMAQTSGMLPADLPSDNVGFGIKVLTSDDNMSIEATETIEAPADAAMIPLEGLLPTAN
jgi:hypothetical protein